MEPSRTRNARDLAAAEARSRPSTQYAAQYPSYPEQAQQLRSRPAQAAPTQVAPPPVIPPRQQVPERQLYSEMQARQVQPPPTLRPARSPAASAPRRLLGVVAFFVLTGLSVPLHVMAVFFVYVQVESPGETSTAGPLLAGMFAAVFVALLITGCLTQMVGGFPGRWRARVTFAFLSGAIALAVAYAAAITQF